MNPKALAALAGAAGGGALLFYAFTRRRGEAPPLGLTSSPGSEAFELQQLGEPIATPPPHRVTPHGHYGAPRSGPPAHAHQGVDLAAAAGSHVLAVGDGRIIPAQPGLGQVVLKLELERPGRWSTLGERVSHLVYADLGTPLVHVGARVRRGDPIATVSSHGFFHFATKTKSSGREEFFDPLLTGFRYRSDAAGELVARNATARATSAEDDEWLVATTIRDQLGPVTLAMLGASALGASSDSLQFSIKGSPKKVTKVRIVLAPDDTYTVEFYRGRGVNLTKLSELDGIYAEQLHSVIRSETGLETTMNVGRRQAAPVDVDAGVNAWLEQLAAAHPQYTYGYDIGPVHIRIWRRLASQDSRNVVAFVERATGTIRKSDSWKKAGRPISTLAEVLHRREATAARLGRAQRNAGVEPRLSRWRSPLSDDGRLAPWVRELRDRNGVYLIRDAETHEDLYIGESHTGRLAGTLTRHLQHWDGRGSGPNYAPQYVEIAVEPHDDPELAIERQFELIRDRQPRDNVQDGRSLLVASDEEIPF